MEHKVKFSLRYKLMLLLIVLPVVTLVAYLILAVHLFKSDKIAYVFDSSAAMTNSLAAQVSSEMNRCTKRLRRSYPEMIARGERFAMCEYFYSLRAVR